MSIVSFSNVDTTGVNGAGAIGAIGGQSKPAGAPLATLITTRANSLVFGVGIDYDGAVARTVGAGQSMVAQLLASVGDTYWVQRLNGSVADVGHRGHDQRHGADRGSLQPGDRRDSPAQLKPQRDLTPRRGQVSGV